MTLVDRDRARALLYSLALGDALGWLARLENLDYITDLADRLAGKKAQSVAATARAVVASGAM